MILRTIESGTRGYRPHTATQMYDGQDTNNAWYTGNLTWEDCHNQLARPDLDPARRSQVELRLEDICRGMC
jgi:hypothetical protein